MVYAPTLGGTVLFGGFYGPGNAEGNLFNVIYLLRPTSNSWEATSYRGPFGRKFQAMFYDSASERIVMFGGLVSYGSPANGLHAGDTWFLSSGPASLVRQPEATRVNPGAQAELFVIAKGGGPIKYQWRHNGEPVQDNERIRGSQSDTMVITATTSQDAGDYTCTVENACGLELSVAAQVEVRCVADLDDGSAAGSPDGGVDISDLLYFLVQFERGQDDADVDDGSGTGTADNAVTIDDLLFFLLRFEAGC